MLFSQSLTNEPDKKREERLERKREERRAEKEKSQLDTPERKSTGRKSSSSQDQIELIIEEEGEDDRSVQGGSTTPGGGKSSPRKERPSPSSVSIETTDESKQKQKQKDSEEPHPVFSCSNFRRDNAWNLIKATASWLGLKNFQPFVIVGIYSLIGAGMFIGLEREHDIQKRRTDFEHRLAARAAFAQKIHDLHVINVFVPDADPKDYIYNAVISFESDIGAQNISLETIWDFYNALLFAGTVYTTIGYGNIAPLTVAGRIVTIIYAIFGIPIVVSALNDLGTILLKFIKKGSRNLGKLYALTIVRFRNRRRVAPKKARRKKLLAASTKSRMAVFDTDGDIFPKCPMTGKDASMVDIEAELQAQELLQYSKYGASRFTLASVVSIPTIKSDDGGKHEDDDQQHEDDLDDEEDRASSPTEPKSPGKVSN